MIRSYRAELAKLLRPRVVLIAIAVAIVFAVGSTIIVLSAVKPAAETIPALRSTATIEALGAAGGGSEVFRLAIAFAGTFFFVVFMGVMAAEFARGTIRTMLLHQPRRTALLTGKVAAMLTFAAGALAADRDRDLDRGPAPRAGRGRGHRRLDLRRTRSRRPRPTSAPCSSGSPATRCSPPRSPWWCARSRSRSRSGSRGRVRSSTWCRTRGPAPAGGSPACCSRRSPGGGTTDVGAGRAIATVAVYVVVAAVVAVTVFARRDVTS